MYSGHDSPMTTQQLSAIYRVELFDYFGKRVHLHRYTTKTAAVLVAQAWLDESKLHTAKVTCGNDGAPITNW